MFSNYQHNAFIYQLTSIAQGTPAHLGTLKDPVAAPFKCPFKKVHDMNFRYENECKNHIQAHRSSSNFQPKLRLKDDEKDKGVFKCNYCDFKTDSETYVNQHLKEAHMNYLMMANKMEELTDNPGWLDIRNNHFTVDYKISLKVSGKYYSTIGNNKRGIRYKFQTLKHFAAIQNINDLDALRHYNNKRGKIQQ